MNNFQRPVTWPNLKFSLKKSPLCPLLNSKTCSKTSNSDHLNDGGILSFNTFFPLFSLKITWNFLFKIKESVQTQTWKQKHQSKWFRCGKGRIKTIFEPEKLKFIERSYHNVFTDLRWLSVLKVTS